VSGIARRATTDGDAWRSRAGKAGGSCNNSPKTPGNDAYSASSSSLAAGMA